MAEPLLAAPSLHIVAVGVTDGDPHGTPRGGSFLKQFVEARERLVQEHRRVYEDVDALAGLRMLDALDVQEGHRVLEIGTGTGWNAALLCHRVGPDGRTQFEVVQSGPRKLWDEVEAALQWWEEQGRPGFERFGLTVGPDEQAVWLDDPDNPVPRTYAYSPPPA